MADEKQTPTLRELSVLKDGKTWEQFVQERASKSKLGKKQLLVLAHIEASYQKIINKADPREVKVLEDHGVSWNSSALQRKSRQNGRYNELNSGAAEINSSTISTALKSLVKRELVERFDKKTKPGKRFRTTHVKLTILGRETAKSFMNATESKENKFIEKEQIRLVKEAIERHGWTAVSNALENLNK